MSCPVISQPFASVVNTHPSVSALWVTPFAGPVLPEVKKMAVGLAGACCISSPIDLRCEATLRLSNFEGKNEGPGRWHLSQN